MFHNQAFGPQAAASYLGQGNVPCYRGHLPFDDGSTQVRRMWSLWTAHYKRFRSILMSDAVHVTRPGQNGGAIETSLHVNASSKESFANFFNPSTATVSRPVRLPMYYANVPRNTTLQVILPPASGVSNEGPRSRVLVPLPAVSWPWVPAWGSLEPPRQDGENAQKTRKNGAKMGEIRSKRCEGRELTKDQLADLRRRRHRRHRLRLRQAREGLRHARGRDPPPARDP